MRWSWHASSLRWCKLAGVALVPLLACQSEGGSAAPEKAHEDLRDAGAASATDATASCTRPCEPGCPCPPSCIDDVPLRFSQIPRHVEAAQGLAADQKDVIPWPRYTSSLQNHGGLNEHFQGIQRVGHYVLLTGSGKYFEPATGHLVVLEMASRSEVGAWSLPNGSASATTPSSTDRIVALVDLDLENWHAGGMQRFDEWLAVALYGDETTRSVVRFYGLEDPTKPREVTGARIERDASSVKAVAGTRLADDRYLVVTWDDVTLDFFLSKSTRLEDGFSQAPNVVTQAEVAGGFQGGGCGVSGCGTYQNVNFVRQCDGTLFLVGARNEEKASPTLKGNDLASLYRVDLPDGVENAPRITFVSRFSFSCEDERCNFGSGAGIHVLDPTHLALYGASHWLHDGNARYDFTEFAAGPTEP